MDLSQFGMRQGAFSHLQDLIDEHLVGKQNLIGVEIGSYAGESAEMFLNSNAFSSLYCIDPWQLHYDPDDSTGNEHLLDAEKAFDFRFDGNAIIQKIKMKSSDAVYMFEDESLDFVYIDGDHRYEFVKTDIMNYFPKVKHGGIISGHDYSTSKSAGVKRAIEEYFKKEPMYTYKDGSWLFIKD